MMVIEIHKPELEALIRHRVADGQFSSVEDAVLEAFRATERKEQPRSARSLAEMFDMARGLADNLRIERHTSPARSVDLS